jgi:hemerythrin
MTGRTFNMGGREVKPGVTRYNFQEAFQDAILAVKKLQQVVERHFGIKLPTRENAWMYENRLSSINMHERKSFIDKVYEPMMKIADRIMKRGVKEKELNAYLICKHGLERNQVFAARDAQAEADEIARNGGVPDMQQLLDKYRQRDYSGLTGVTGIHGDITDIEAEAQRIVDEFEQRHGQLCNELWDAIRKASMGKEMG